MNIKWGLGAFLLWTSVALSDEPARLAFSSATDFTAISITLKSTERPDRDNLEVNVVLSPEAKARTKSITLLAFHKYMTLYVDGYQLSTSMVQSELGGEFRFLAPRALVNEWMAARAQPTM